MFADKNYRQFPMLMVIGKIVCLLFVLMAVLPASGRADDFARLRQDAARISTISAGFTQKKTMKILSKPLLSEGNFYFAAPDAIRWEYTKPIKSVTVSSKGNTKRYISSGSKMVEDKSGGVQAMKIALNEIAGWIRGKFEANPSFSATIKEGANTQVILTPVDKNMAGMIEKIEITFSRREMSVRSVRIIESASAETQIDFHQVAINKVIDPCVFQELP